MSVYLEGDWERSETPSVDGNDRFRLFCVASNAVDTLRVSNFNNAWRTDGSEIGRWTKFERATTPGRASATIAGSLYSGALGYIVPNPPTITPGRVYPSATLNPAGGWRYEPFDFGLPQTLALPAEMNAGYPSDVQIEITVHSTIFMRATITSIVFDDRWNTLWLEDRRRLGARIRSSRQSSISQDGRFFNKVFGMVANGSLSTRREQSPRNFGVSVRCFVV